MDIGHFYFLADKYFTDFPDLYLERNKETINGQSHSRPCFYAFTDNSTQIYWVIPFSSKIAKYQAVYEKKIQKYGECDTIVFGDVLGYKKAFLIQNMCPVISDYIENEYIDTASNVSVKVNGSFEKILQQKASRVLALERSGRKIIFPDVLKIERQLILRIS